RRLDDSRDNCRKARSPAPNSHHVEVPGTVLITSTRRRSPVGSQQDAPRSPGKLNEDGGSVEPGWNKVRRSPPTDTSRRPSGRQFLLPYATAECNGISRRVSVSRRHWKSRSDVATKSESPFGEIARTSTECKGIGKSVASPPVTGTVATTSLPSICS